MGEQRPVWFTGVGASRTLYPPITKQGLTQPLYPAAGTSSLHPECDTQFDRTGLFPHER